MTIAMVASEANPLIKTGGLADVVYSLSKELVKIGEEVAVILPYYKSIKTKAVATPTYLGSYTIQMSWRLAEAKIYRTIIDGITYYLIDNERYFNRDNPYGYMDDGERFAFFTMAVKELFSYLNIFPDVIHVHDWQAGMLPCLIKEDNNDDNSDSRLKKAKLIFTIHNPAFQGLMPKEMLGDFYNLDDELYDSGKVRFKDQLSTLKTGIVYSDKITTVSPTHRYELLTPEGSMGLDGVLRLREKDFIGILNGIDTEEFDPENDSKIFAKFSISNFKEQKEKNKEDLFKELNIKNTGKPLFSLVTRLTWQKGLDLVYDACNELANRGCNIVVLGSGEYQYEQMVENLRAKFPDRIAVYIGYNDNLAHKIYAASDFFLMPSLFEPCGIGQLIAMRYGVLPIIRRTGGLADSVNIYNGKNKDTSTGFGFDEYSEFELKRTCVYAYDTWWDEQTRDALIRNAMRFNSTWKRSAKDYLSVYESVKK